MEFIPDSIPTLLNKTPQFIILSSLRLILSSSTLILDWYPHLEMTIQLLIADFFSNSLILYGIWMTITFEAPKYLTTVIISLN